MSIQERGNAIGRGLRGVREAVSRRLADRFLPHGEEEHLLNASPGSNVFFLQYAGLDISLPGSDEHIQILEERGCKSGICAEVFYIRGDIYGNATRPRRASKSAIAHVRGDDTIPEKIFRDAFEFNDDGMFVAGSDNIPAALDYVRNRIEELSREGVIQPQQAPKR